VTRRQLGMLSEASLPIFRIAPLTPEYALFYTPGYLAAVRPELATAFERAAQGGASAPWPEAAALNHAARVAQQAWEARAARPYAPLCLTLYLHNACNLNCAYCFSATGAPRPAAPRLAPETVRAAAEAVAKNCARAGQRLTVVFHGGGEPALDFDLLRAALAAVEDVAATHRLRLFRYIATNGVMPAADARWLAEHFDSVGLSCDGPPSIQRRQRPLLNGADSAPFVEQTARLVLAAGKPLHVRVTLTPATATRQVEIADYLCRHLQPQEIQVEPVYAGGHAEAEGWEAASPAAFVAEFLKARAAAGSQGVPWLTSGSRPGDIHGPYCQVFRDVLQLTPAGTAAACFKVVETASSPPQAQAIGHVNAAGRFDFDAPRLETLRQALSAEPPNCAACFNRYHCARCCPDVCILERFSGPSSFRCQVQQRLTLASLHEAATALCAAGPATAGSPVPLPVVP
jgi:sulfatase maturation enzyme AslB (radical SAM superfamily)